LITRNKKQDEIPFSFLQVLKDGTGISPIIPLGNGQKLEK
jgi:hypothetical protein